MLKHVNFIIHRLHTWVQNDKLGMTFRILTDRFIKAPKISH